MSRFPRSRQISYFRGFLGSGSLLAAHSPRCARQRRGVTPAERNRSRVVRYDPPPSDRGQGRKPLSPSGELMRSRPIRMTNEQWEKFKRLGGPGWLRDRIDRAREKK